MLICMGRGGYQKAAWSWEHVHRHDAAMLHSALGGGRQPHVEGALVLVWAGVVTGVMWLLSLRPGGWSA